jgi:hypothetical protein
MRLPIENHPDLLIGHQKNHQFNHLSLKDRGLNPRIEGLRLMEKVIEVPKE